MAHSILVLIQILILIQEYCNDISVARQHAVLAQRACVLPIPSVHLSVERW